MDYAPPGLGERVKNRLGETAGNVGDKISDALPNKWQDELDRIGEEPATDEERALGDFGTPNKRANQAWENRAGGLGDEPATDAERRLEPEASDTGKWADRAAALDQPEETAPEKKSGQGLEERTGDALPTSGDRWENRAGGLGDEPATDAERALGNFQDPGNRANQAWENRASGLGDEPATDAERALGPETRDSGKWADKSKRIQKQEEAKAAVDSIQNTLRQEQNFFERKIQDIQLDIGEDRGKIKSLQNEIWQKRLDALLTLARYTIWIIILALALLILLVASILIITLPFTVPAMGSVLRSITTAFISLGRKLTKIYAEIKKKQGEIESLKQKIKGPVQEIKQVQQQFNQRRKTLQKQIQDLQKQVSK
jgi:hypothetical protein